MFQIKKRLTKVSLFLLAHGRLFASLIPRELGTVLRTSSPFHSDSELQSAESLGCFK
ncbi:MAG: hypothetical protein J6U64_00910 [Alphaproteobacteria bacterium]|nr:hypothetical protein [Alphaproteobacteria bacterium]